MTLDYEPDDRFEEWEAAVGAWQPRPPARPMPGMPRGHRAGLMLLIVLGHAIALWLLDHGSRMDRPDPAGETTTLVFLMPEPPPAPAPAAASEPDAAVARTRDADAPSPEPEPAATSAPPSLPAAQRARAADAATPPRPVAPLVAVEAGPRPREPLRLFETDGSLRLPDDVVARLDTVDGDRRTFDFQRPGLLESGRFMDRQPVLVYEPTRFDQYWIPEKDVLTSVLEKAVEATTGTVEIPIPGSPGSKLVCTVSVLALGGGCGIRNNNDGYVVSLDDPATLDPEEDAQCRAWWDQIVAAGDQDTWRHTRALYEASCRKPLAKDAAPPEVPAG